VALFSVESQIIPYSHLSVLQTAHKSLLHTWLDLFERVIEITAMSLEKAKGISVLVVLQRSCNTESSVSLSPVEALVTYTSDYFPGGLDRAIC